MSVLEVLFAAAIASAASSVDAADVYGKPTPCIQVACPPNLKVYLGAWDGKFEAFDQDTNQYRPFDRDVLYSDRDVLREPISGDVFVIGHETDAYPGFNGLAPKVEHQLVVRGLRHGEAGRPYLRIVESDGVLAFKPSKTPHAPGELYWETHIQDQPGVAPALITLREAPDPRGVSQTVTMQLAAGEPAAVAIRGVLHRSATIDE